MIVGLPGAGISAFFYLLLVLLMPFKLAWNAIRRTEVRRDQLKLITRQMLIGAGILGSFTVIGLVLAAVLPEPAPVVEGAAGNPTAVAVERGIARVGVFLGIATLVGVLVVTRLLAFALSPRRSIPRPLRRRAVPVRLRTRQSSVATRRARGLSAPSRAARAPG